MLIPSIDLMNGQTVQLIQGDQKALDAGDPRPIAERFGMVGEIAVIDLDAATGRGSNANLIEPLLKIARVRVGGGIRNVETAIRWLDAGAVKVILGTAAKPEILSQLPRERVIAAVDARDGEVVVEGWRQGSGAKLLDRIRELRDYVGGFLVTFVETEGTLSGLDMNKARAVIEAAAGVPVTLAGGIRSPEEIRELDQMGADAQVGMAIYTGRFDLADSIAAVMQSDRPDHLWPTIVVDELGTALGLTYSSLESLRVALQERSGVYWSRKRGLWRKGASSGSTQELLRVDVDCDRDALRFTVRQTGTGFCHRGTQTCFGNDEGLPALERRMFAAAAASDSKSYTARLIREPKLLHAKLREEAAELCDAATDDEIIHEAADVIYFAMVKLVSAGLSLEQVAAELDRRSRRITRRPGDAKPQKSP